MSARRGGPRKPRASKGSTPSLDLPPPRPLSGLERELYELLVADLQDAVEKRLKTERRKTKAVAELATLAVREGKLRAQLTVFEPELGDMGTVVDLRPPNSPGPYAPGPQ